MGRFIKRPEEHRCLTPSTFWLWLRGVQPGDSWVCDCGSEYLLEKNYFTGDRFWHYVRPKTATFPFGEDDENDTDEDDR